MADVINFSDYTDDEATSPVEAPESPVAARNSLLPAKTKVKAFHDFDAMWSEKEEEVLEIYVYGETHYLPASVPADIVLGILRLQANGIQSVPEEQVLHMTTSIFGEERLAAWCTKGLTIDRMGDLLGWALDQYQSQKPMGNQTSPKVKRGKARQ